MAKEDPRPILKKDEFETTVAYKKRVTESNELWEIHKSQIKQKNDKIIREYDHKLNDAEAEYRKKIELYSREDYKKDVYKQTLTKAVQIVLGKPYFKDFQYDADSQTMKAVVFSARESSFKKQVEFLVPIATAKNFKSDLQNNVLIPLVILDQYLNVVTVDAVTNEEKISLDFSISKGQNSIASYEKFIIKYPKSSHAKLAELEIVKLQEQARKAELERLRAAAEREKRIAAAKERDRQAYLASKKIGDKVCKPGSVAFGLIGITISAYVERIEGDRMELRINSTDGQSIYYNGVSLWNGTLIWDQYYEWKLCN